MTDVEEPLYGGLIGGRIVRVGETVRRPGGAWTATHHALLNHLQTKGFPASRPLGVDAKGREILSFLPGQCSNWPWPPALLADEGARQVGAMLAAYHAAVADFTPPAPAVWRHGPQGLAPGEIVLHGDFAPHNLIWNEGRLTGVIDFELARPGPALEDAAFAVIRVAQLRPDEMAAKAGFSSPPRRRQRLEAFAEGYGCSLDWLIGGVRPAQISEQDRTERLGGAGIEPYASALGRGIAEVIRIELAWIDENLAAIASS
jgi:Ser/Thr protein kinase RdoA (MazF antagonist)